MPNFIAPFPAAADGIPPVQGAGLIAGALKAADFTASEISPALVNQNVYPELTAYQLGSALLSPDAFPLTQESEMQTLLAETQKYSAAQIAYALQLLYGGPTKLGPAGGGDFYYGPPVGFDDLQFALQVGVPITGFNLRSGDIVDSLQAIYGKQAAPQHGGNYGSASSVTFDAGDALVKVSGYAGNWFGSTYILQVAFTTAAGKVYGPYGQTTSGAAFTFQAQAGEQILALFGQIVLALQYGHEPSYMVNELGVYTVPNSTVSRVSYGSP